jgi:hypothetical protein
MEISPYLGGDQRGEEIWVYVVLYASERGIKQFTHCEHPFSNQSEIDFSLTNIFSLVKHLKLGKTFPVERNATLIGKVSYHGFILFYFLKFLITNCSFPLSYLRVS